MGSGRAYGGMGMDVRLATGRGPSYVSAPRLSEARADLPVKIHAFKIPIQVRRPFLLLPLNGHKGREGPAKGVGHDLASTQLIPRISTHPHPPLPTRKAAHPTWSARLPPDQGQSGLCERTSGFQPPHDMERAFTGSSVEIKTMHPALVPDVLSGLLPLMRRIANKAILADAQPADWVRFIRLFHTASLDTLKLFAPVLMANLAIEHIPSVHHFDSDTPPGYRDCKDLLRAEASLRLMTTRGFMATLPPSSLSDVWERVWPWMRFTSTYHQPLGSEHGEGLLGPHAPLIALLRRDPSTVNMIDAATGARAIVAQSIKCMFLHPEDNPGGWELANGWHLLSEMQIKGIHHLDELLDGFSVSLSGLASLMVEHLQFVNRKFAVDDDDDGRPTDLLESIALVYSQITDFSDSLTVPAHSSGIVPAITAILRTIVGEPTQPFHHLPILWIHLAETAAPARMLEAINAGLMPILVIGAARQHPDPEIHAEIDQFLKPFLSGFTVYRSVLEAIQAALPEADALASSAEFAVSSCTKAWASFRSVVQQRIAVLKWYCATHFQPLQGCDGPVCGKVVPRDETRLCSGCRSVYYCSRACQKADWREDGDVPRPGSHRNMCSKLRNTIPIDPFTRRDRLFLQALVRRDYTEHRAEIAAKCRDALADIHAPGFMSTACVAVFDYTRGVLDISPRTWTRSDEDKIYAGAAGHEPADQVLLQQSCFAAWGRMQTHESDVVVVRVLCGHERTREQLVWL
ncbi:hypothetical protein B0H14DRAFT_2627304 [Mycena olivaceomarginata]|nr:hypothetical protein B0H14DRAFT_2627304 [Mycena olivaceomarginata]